MPQRTAKHYKRKMRTKRNQIIRNSERDNRRIVKLSIILLSLLIFIFIFKLLQAKSTLWNGTQKVFVAFVEEDQPVEVVVFDPPHEEITRVVVPRNTQITASRQYGEIMVGKLLELGNQEGYNGQLLVESLTYHARLPTHAYADYKLLPLATGESIKIFKILFAPGDTNIAFFDRLQLGLFSLRISNANRSTIDLSQTSYLSKTTFSSGEEGYSVSSTLPQSIVSLFSFEELSRAGTSVHIIQKTEDARVVKNTGELLELLGGKIVTIEQLETDNSDCIVVSQNVVNAELISRLLKCEVIEDTSLSPGEMYITLGEKFSERY